LENAGVIILTAMTVMVKTMPVDRRRCVPAALR